MGNKPAAFQLVAKTPKWGFDLSHQIAIALTHQGYHVVTIFLNGEFSQRVADRYPGKSVFPQLDHKKPWWRLQASYILIRLCRKYNFETIISHHYKPSSLMAFVDRIIPQRKLFMVNHNPNNLRRQARVMAIRYLFSNRWSFVGVSRWVVRDFLSRASFLDPDRMHVLHNCIDIDMVKDRQMPAAEARSALGVPDDSFVFGNIHRLDKSKGHDYMIRAFAIAARHMPYAHLVIIGGGNRKQLLENIAREEGVEDRVHLAGVLDNASAYATGFDVFVSPSLHEGFGLGLLEGMAAYLPTLTSTGGASPEVVGDTGLQFAPGDTDKLAEHMLSIYQMSEQDRKRMGAASYERLTNLFSSEIYHRNVVALFT